MKNIEKNWKTRDVEWLKYEKKLTESWRFIQVTKLPKYPELCDDELYPDMYTADACTSILASNKTNTPDE
jgi:hypothetical protein